MDRIIEGDLRTGYNPKIKSEKNCTYDPVFRDTAYCCEVECYSY